jgi:dTDP-4-dehydrorhamnose reductase
MKKIVIIGIGMAGHVLYKYLKSLNKYILIGISKSKNDYVDYQLDIETELFELGFILGSLNPDVIINCTGVLIKTSEDYPYKAIYINSFFPHWLEHMYRNSDTKIVHLSTDCIFDGKRGGYSEKELPTETNWYGRTKAMGELNNIKDLTLRLSIIGPELKKGGTGLFQWFMNQTGIVSGYKNVFWNGITTLELAKQIGVILDTDLTGIYHLVTTSPIIKGDLLELIREVWHKSDIKIEPNFTIFSNKTLINSRLKEYNPSIPDYYTQLKELYNWYE